MNSVAALANIGGLVCSRGCLLIMACSGGTARFFNDLSRCASDLGRLGGISLGTSERSTIRHITGLRSGVGLRWRLRAWDDS